MAEENTATEQSLLSSENVEGEKPTGSTASEEGEKPAESLLGSKAKEVVEAKGDQVPAEEKPAEAVVLEAVKDSPFDDTFVKDLAKVLTDKQVSKEAATELHKKYADQVLQKTREHVAEQKKIAFQDWPKQVKEDPEIGREKFKESLAVAHKAYLQYAPLPLRQMLDASGLANHPEMVRMFVRLGLANKNDSAVISNQTTQPPRKPEDIFYRGNK